MRKQGSGEEEKKEKSRRGKIILESQLNSPPWTGDLQELITTARQAWSLAGGLLLLLLSRFSRARLCVTS